MTAKVRRVTLKHSSVSLESRGSKKRKSREHECKLCFACTFISTIGICHVVWHHMFWFVEPDQEGGALGAWWIVHGLFNHSSAGNRGIGDWRVPRKASPGGKVRHHTCLLPPVQAIYDRHSHLDRWSVESWSREERGPKTSGSNVVRDCDYLLYLQMVSGLEEAGLVVTSRQPYKQAFGPSHRNVASSQEAWRVEKVYAGSLLCHSGRDVFGSRPGEARQRSWSASWGVFPGFVDWGERSVSLWSFSVDEQQAGRRSACGSWMAISRRTKSCTGTISTRRKKWLERWRLLFPMLCLVLLRRSWRRNWMPNWRCLSVLRRLNDW